MTKTDLLFKRCDFQTIFVFIAIRFSEFVGVSIKIEKSKKDLKTSFKSLDV